jgi:hypothetical protein
MRRRGLLTTLPLGGDRVLVSVAGNYQRLRRHRFDRLATDRLRLRVTATGGSDFARVFEIRCYA